MKAEVKMYNGRTAIVIDEKVCPPSFMTVRTRANNGNDIMFDKEYFKKLGESGIKLFPLHCNTLWLQPHALEIFDKEARLLLEAVPDAYIVPRIGLHPTNEWIVEHPEECRTYSDGTKPGMHLFTESYETDCPMIYGLFSSKWREAAGEALAELWRRMMGLPYADHIVGCFPAAGSTSEWTCPIPFIDTVNKRAFEHSEAFKREFSCYLRDTYGTDENLRKAWKREDASIAHPILPTYDEHYFYYQVDRDVNIPPHKIYSFMDFVPERSKYAAGSFLNHDICPHVFDFYRALHYGTARSQLHFAKIIKEITPDRLVFMCYGAQGAVDPVNGGRTGYTRMILDSDCYDIMLNPSVYVNRIPGGAVGQRVCQDSFSLHNKVYISQEDNRTLAETNYQKKFSFIYDLEDSVNLMKREFGKNICNDIYCWWFDQLPGGKRYKYPEIYELLKRQQEIGKEAYSLNREKKSEIAFIFDEESMQSVSLRTHVDIIEALRNFEIAKIGAPVDQYYHNDMADPDMPSYKMYVFVNTFILTEEEREVIKEKLRKDHAIAVWIYAPGFIDTSADQKLSVEHMEDLTGIHMKMVDDCIDCVFRWNGEKHPINENLDERAYYGKIMERYFKSNSAKDAESANWSPYLYPLFCADDKDARHLAYFGATEYKYPAVSVKEAEGYTSVLYGAKHIKRDVLREMARFAGAHIWCESDDVTYIGRNYITFHASSKGMKTLKFPEAVDVYEVYENKCYGKAVTELDFEVYTGETKMFRMIPMEA